MKNLMFAVLALFLVGATCPNEVYAQKKKKEKQKEKDHSWSCIGDLPCDRCGWLWCL